MTAQTQREVPWVGPRAPGAAAKLPLSCSQSAYGAIAVPLEGYAKLPKRELRSRTPKLACGESRRSE